MKCHALLKELTDVQQEFEHINSLAQKDYVILLVRHYANTRISVGEEFKIVGKQSEEDYMDLLRSHYAEVEIALQKLVLDTEQAMKTMIEATTDPQTAIITTPSSRKNASKLARVSAPSMRVSIPSANSTIFIHEHIFRWSLL